MLRAWRIVVSAVAIGCVGCGDGPRSRNGGDDDDPRPVSERVAAAVEADCSPESLEALSDADPLAVRQALIGLDASLKEPEWTVGLTQGAPIRAEYRAPLHEGYEFTYDVHVPEAYQADPDDPLPVFVDPAHPRHPVDDPDRLPWLASLIDEAFLLLRVNFYNRLFEDLGEEAYTDAVALSTTDAYMDHRAAFQGALADVRRRYHVDSSRIYVGGISASGAATWFLGNFSSDEYAAINPYSSWPAAYHEDVYRNLMHLGILPVQGTDDDVTPVENVRPVVEMLEGWGYDVEYWEMEGEGHGTMFTAVLGDAVDWMLERRRDLTPERVHLGMESERASAAFWLVASSFPSPLPEERFPFFGNDPAVLDATWRAGRVEIEAVGVREVELRWLEGESGGPGSGGSGDSLVVVVNGTELEPVELTQDPTVAVEDYCRHADIARLWAGRVRVEVP